MIWVLFLLSPYSWTAVATWRWVANDDNCGICRMAFDGCCPDCKIPGDDCPLGEGFHKKVLFTCYKFIQVSQWKHMLSP